MRRYIPIIAILIIALAAVSFVGGCSKKQSSSPQVSSAPEPAKEKPAEAKAPEAKNEAGPLGDLMQKQAAVTSYVMDLDAMGMKVKTKMKLENGKPVRMKADLGDLGWTLIQYDKGVQYQYVPTMKVAMKSAASAPGGSAGSAPGMDSVAALKQLATMNVSSDTLDGVDCVKASKKDGSMTMWVEKEHGLPVQMESGGKTMKFKYEQINAVPDSEFELPAGVKVQETPKEPGG